MSTIVNTPTSEEASVAIVLVGVLFTIAVVALFLVYGLPAIQSMTNPTPSTPQTIDVNLEIPKDLTPAPATEPAPAKTP